MFNWAVAAEPFVVVGAGEIDGQPVLQLMGTRLEQNNEVPVNVWVDADSRLVRMVKTRWISVANPFGNPAIATNDFRYPTVAPDIAPRP